MFSLNESEKLCYFHNILSDLAEKPFISWPASNSSDARFSNLIIYHNVSHEKQQVHISEARVATALDKLAYMEELVNDRLLQDRNTSESDQRCTSMQYLNNVKGKLPRKSLNVSGPVQPYHPQLKNFWYPVAFSADLKEDTMVQY